MVRAMTERDLSRTVSACAVLLLHLVLIAMFLTARISTPRLAHALHEIALTLPAPLRHEPALPAALPPRLVVPTSPPAIAPPTIRISPGAGGAGAVPGEISGVGRALFGCSPARLGLLSPEARKACQRIPPGAPHEASLRLGPPPDPASPFAREIEERFRRAVPINRPCPLGSYNDIRGLPCFGFDDGSSLLPQR
jgi:hypothetical protein